MVAVNLVYEGDLRVKATHAPSGDQLVTDAPVDNHGKGEHFSPTDLVSVALGTCMATLMGIAAQRKQIDIAGLTVDVEKTMATAAPRRIAELKVRICCTKHVAPEFRKMLESAALTCPVHHSLHPEIKVPVEFVWA